MPKQEVQIAKEEVATTNVVEERKVEEPRRYDEEEDLDIPVFLRRARKK